MSQELVDKTRDLEPGERVILARHPNRPHIEDFVENVFTDFFMMRTAPSLAASPAFTEGR